MKNSRSSVLNTQKKPSTVYKILKLLGRYRLLVIISAIFAAMTVVMTLFVPILIGDAIDLMIGEGLVDIEGIVKLLITAGVLIAATALLQWLMSSINNRITYHIVRDMRNTAFERLERLPISYVDSHKKGDIVSRMISDVDQFADGLLLGFTQLFTGVLTIVGTLVFMVRINWRIALIVVLLTPLSLFTAKFIASRTHSMFMLRSKTTGEQTALIDEMIGNQKVVVAFSHEDEAAERFDEVNGRLEKCTLKAIFFSSLVNPTTRFVNNMIYAAVALVGALAVMSSGDASFTVGGLTCLLSYTNQYTKPFNEISGVITEFQNAIACAGRYFEFVEAEPEIPDAPDAKVLENVLGNVRLEGVSFSYSPDKKLLENVSIDAEAGSRIAIVGPTGCGKTTLINLLMRFYDVRSGSITVDGTDVRNITRHSLRKNYGMVLQETWLGGGTVRDNIAFGKPDATMEEVIAAAKAAHAHSFIKRLEHGYDTVIDDGDGDGILSQGQKQLICIARVMLSLPPMLILDEATSSIDTRTEIKIQDAFSEMMKGRTSFIVAHRLSTVRKCDTILVMKDGNIIEQGSHAELLEKGGFYRELYDSQFAH